MNELGGNFDETWRRRCGLEIRTNNNLVVVDFNKQTTLLRQ
jgi:hypothetical protein